MLMRLDDDTRWPVFGHPSTTLDLDPRRTLIVQRLIALAVVMIGLVGFVSAPSEEYSSWRVAVLLVVSASSVAAAAWWFFGAWPSRRALIGFMIYADASLTVCLLFKDDHLIAVSGTVLFAIVTVLAVIATSLRTTAIHMAYTVVVLAFVAAKAIHFDAASTWVVSAHSLTMLIMFCTPIVLLMYVGELRARGQAALIDPLTGVANRRGFFVRAERVCHDMDRVTDARSMTLVAIDIDGFKRVNDTHGHHRGDETLSALALHLMSRATKASVIARMGGDEFVCLFAGEPAMTERASTDLMVDLIDARLPGGVTVSVGHASTVVERRRHPSEMLQSLLRDADFSMYRAKRARDDRPSASTCPLCGERDDDTSRGTW